jgi:hypothetical protein
VGVTQDSSSFGSSIIDFKYLRVVGFRIRVSISSTLFKLLSITFAYSKEDPAVELLLDNEFRK